MAAAFWKEQDEMSACIESARRKMRAARKFQRAGSRQSAYAARYMAANCLERARWLKNQIEARHPIRK